MRGPLVNPDFVADREWHEQLRGLITYDPLTGKFTWLVTQGRAVAGKIAGRTNPAGYCQIQINGKRVVASHLAWLMVHGVWPDGLLDHKDLDRQNNRIANLRPASPSQNVANQRARRNNLSGLKGAFRTQVGRPYYSEVRKDGRRVHLGRFDTKEEAHAAYAQKAGELFGEFARSA